MSRLAALCLVFLVARAQNDDPAPVSEETVPRACFESEDCRRNGDAEARCSDDFQECICSQEFGDYQGVPGCFPLNPSEDRTRVPVTIRGVFPDADCEAFIAATGHDPEVAVEQVLRESLELEEQEVLVTCGSVHFASHATVLLGQATQLVDEAAVAQRMAAAFEGRPELNRTLGGAATLRVPSVAFGTSRQCHLPAANSTVVLNDVCHALSCEEGFLVTPSAEGYRICVRRRPRSVDEDDDLSGGAIAGIVVGSIVAGILLVAALVWFLMRKREEGKPVAYPQQQQQQQVEQQTHVDQTRVGAGEPLPLHEAEASPAASARTADAFGQSNVVVASPNAPYGNMEVDPHGVSVMDLSQSPPPAKESSPAIDV